MIPNEEVLSDWSNFMQSKLNPKLVAKQPSQKSKKTPERLYRVYLLGLLQGLKWQGWEVNVELHSGLGYINVGLVSEQKHAGVLIEVKSSEHSQHLDRDADRALRQITDKNYQNIPTHSGINYIREYGMANFHLESVVKGRYLVRSGSDWVKWRIQRYKAGIESSWSIRFLFYVIP